MPPCMHGWHTLCIIPDATQGNLKYFFRDLRYTHSLTNMKKAIPAYVSSSNVKTTVNGVSLCPHWQEAVSVLRLCCGSLCTFELVTGHTGAPENIDNQFEA